MSREQSYGFATPIANKVLNPDGSITTLAGAITGAQSESTSPNIQRAKAYEQTSPIINKVLMPDGAIVTLAEAIGAPGAGGSGGDDIQGDSGSSISNENISTSFPLPLNTPLTDDIATQNISEENANVTLVEV